MTRRDILLYLLREAGERGVTTAEIIQAGVGSRYGARLLELREEGFLVEAVRERQSCFRYTLVSEPDVERAAGAPAPGAPLSGGGLAAPIPPASGPLSVMPDRLFEPEPDPHWRESDAA